MRRLDNLRTGKFHFQPSTFLVRHCFSSLEARKNPRRALSIFSAPSTQAPTSASKSLEALNRQALRFLEQTPNPQACLNKNSPQIGASEYACSLRACSDQKLGQELHREIVSNGMEQDPLLGTQIVQMYLRCGSISAAEELFQRLFYRGVILWTLIISSHMNNGNQKLALKRFQEMQLHGIKPDRAAFLTILHGLESSEFLAEVRRLNRLYLMESDLVLANSLICVYGKCLAIGEARETFDRISQRDLVSWNSIIGAYCQSGEMQLALNLFRIMQLEGVRPGLVTFVSVLTACNSLAALKDGKQVHACSRELGLEKHIVLSNALLNMYSKCGSPGDAREIFDGLEERDLVSWTAIISAYSDDHHQASNLFKKMQLEGIQPDKVVFVTLLEACSSPEAASFGRLVHARASERGLESDLIVGNALVHMYGKCGIVEEARKMFDKLSHRDVISWNTIIGICSQHGLWRESIDLFFRMHPVKPDSVTFMTVVNSIANLQEPSTGKLVHKRIVETGLETDSIVGTNLVNMYGKCGCLEEARELFDRIPEKRLVMWNCLLSAYVQHRRHREALRLFAGMIMKPDRITLVTVINACAALASIREARGVHERVSEAGLEQDVFVGTAMVDMYSKCGTLEQALRVFESMSERNTISWNSMIAAFAQHGEPLRAVTLFREMMQEDFTPDNVTFVNALSACSHGGMFEPAEQYFTSMVPDFELRPEAEHFGCMVDLLGRLGWLEEAESFISRMPVPLNPVIQATFLGACRTHGDVARAKKLADRMLEKEPEDVSSYVVLSSVLAEAGKFEEAGKLRKLRIEKGLRKIEAGCSWIEIGGRVHEFVVGDTSHPRWREINEEVDRMNRLMREAGYSPDTGLVAYEREKGWVIGHHSERLAVALAMISDSSELENEDSSTIRVMKNLRVCRDCHSAFKFMSSILKRRIVVRDSHRFHHFVDGACSCVDFW